MTIGPSGKLTGNTVILESTMITLQEICRYLDELLSADTFGDSCPNGLQVEGRREVRSIATAVSASLRTIEAATEKKVDLLLVHHGIFWNKDSYVILGVKCKKIKLLLDQQISLVAYHLPLDAHQQFGNNWRAAMDLGWTDLRPFCFINGAPIGVQGRVANLPTEQFQRSLEKYYNHPAHAAVGGKSRIQSAALVSGGAHRSLLDAVKSGVDAFVTGSFDEPNWHQAFEEKINFYALGHSATEIIGPKALGEHLRDKFGLRCEFIEDANPF